MKTINKNEISNLRPLTDVVLASCQKLASQIDRVKNNLLAEFRDTFETHGQLLQHAVNQADALAWQTAYPQLVFPTLALERVQAAARWSVRQDAIRRNHAEEIASF